MARRLAILGARLFPMTAPPGPARGPDLDRLVDLPRGALLVEDGRILWLGRAAEVPRAFLRGAEVVQARGRALLPGFVDPHTHLPFYGWRTEEYAARLRGEAYTQQQRPGDRPRGIAQSVHRLAQASDRQVVAFGRALLAEALAQGTTAVELKTGYGGDLPGELRHLRLAQGLSRAPRGRPWPRAAVSLLALHGRPPGEGAARWLRQVAEELLPLAAAQGVHAVDAFVDPVGYTPQEVRPVLAAAQALGLAIHLHADQFGAVGGADLAVEVGARSADHLEHLREPSLSRLARSPVVAVLLPGAAHTLRSQALPPARDLIAAGAAVALGTDLNPGTSPIASMPAVISLAVARLDLTPEEALMAATRNAAHALGLGEVTGHLAPGMAADLQLLDTDDPREIPSRLGHAPAAAVWVAGRPLRPRRMP